MSTDTGQVGQKQFYHELTEKQQVVVDAAAELPSAMTNRAIAEEADGEVSTEYVRVVRNEYDDIIEEREVQLNNDHETTERGNVTVEGEIDISDVQDIQDRPVKDPSESDTDEPAYRCGCGRTFDSGPAYGGHARACDASDPSSNDDAGAGDDTAEKTIDAALAAVLPDDLSEVFGAVDPDEFDLRVTENGTELTLSWGGDDGR